MKSVPNIDYSKLQPKAQEKPVGKYGNLKNFLKERDGAEVDESTIDKKLRTFFEDMITEVLKNPKQWDRTRNINFTELFNYLSGQDDQQPEQPEVPTQPAEKLAGRTDLVKKNFEISATPEVMERLERFLSFFHYNPGHSGAWGMEFDGDGSDVLKVEPKPAKTESVGGVGELRDYTFDRSNEKR